MKTSQLTTLAAFLVVVLLVGHLVIIGKPILAPLVMALLLVGVLHVIAEGIEHLFERVGVQIGRVWSLTASAVSLGALATLMVWIIRNNVASMVARLPDYQNDLMTMLRGGVVDTSSLGLESLLEQVSIGSIVNNVVSSFASIGSQAFLILLLAIFLLSESRLWQEKFTRLIEHRQGGIWGRVTHEAAKSMTDYLRIKTFGSFLTAIACYVFLALAGVDFAPLWALLVFFLNYIPTIGSIIATAMPALWVLVQNGSWSLFIVTIVSLIVIQLLIGNGIEPRIAGRSLNLSPTMIFLSLLVWGALWGSVGMIVAVPALIIIRTVLSQFPHMQGLVDLISLRPRIQ